ncbi:MAG: electron transfer flavoprotein subunit alpha/FixB family protein [Vicinamibacterales bacterium]|jgi:electron transfer flavoprotein alpha subunit|nr:electron transfer flavoprotein subunit alpha [Acidobacteriota bacterium]MDP6371460.1 electron transfer flavoprotein subunit alpha/FixB family protein [Vicinamibacterales bacterium]MDP6609371.1 electron transfer flavoprotein subunit alpha/FixB family protein [Vicinamibacterales bacterium]HAK54216.1 electron transfer flavoprotein subunit alpha/FixB family protein [Acidobacteriota bacterium]|tara:strand:+ start:5058 stop:6017 length:960 start_codon:yes stop_codon:yes gene_type:complete
MLLVIAEQRDGVLNRASAEALTAAQQMGDEVKVALLGAGLNAAAAELAAADVAEVLVLDAPALEHYTADGFVRALTTLVAAEAPALVVLPHTYQTRDFAPALAVALDRALLTDCVRAVRRDGTLAFSRPMFQGKLMADVVPLGPAPHLVTFQSGAVSAEGLARGATPAPTRAVDVALDAAAIRQRPEAPFQEAKQAVDLSQADRIVAVGRGIKGEEHVELARRLAEALGAEVAASRPICDAGWLPMDRQVGSSGQTVAPTLYLALGISGAIQHVVGMKGAKTIVAVNKDADAPIFEIADYGIVGDLFDVVPAMIAALEA